MKRKQAHSTPGSRYTPRRCTAWKVGSSVIVHLEGCPRICGLEEVQVIVPVMRTYSCRALGVAE